MQKMIPEVLAARAAYHAKLMNLRLSGNAMTALVLSGSLVAGMAQTLPGWNLVWSDEFSQADGSAPDASKWGYDTGGGGWGNNELQYYTSRTNNARIEGGQLVIEARQESYGGRNYTSARLLTKGKKSWTYGRIEARLKIPRGQGIWPAFWMLGANIDSLGWPACGEIDVMENIGREPGIIHGTVHGPGYSGGNSIGGSFTFAAGTAVADDFHVFAVEWETNRIRWFVDGTNYFNVTPGSLPAGASWVFNAPEFILLNLAVGGNWPGNPDATTVFPQRLLVDYVRVYARANPPKLGSQQLKNPGIESGFTNWTKYGANVLVETISSMPVHDGTNSMKIFGQFTGGENYSGFHQMVSAIPGSRFTAECWAITAGTDRLAGGNSAWLEVTFRDSKTNVLALYRSPALTAATSPGAWVHLAATNRHDPSSLAFLGTVTNLVAPNATAWAGFRAVFRQPAGYDAGSVFFDDLSLRLLNGSVPPLQIQTSRQGQEILLGFLTLAGLVYRIEWRSPLSQQWQVLATGAGDGYPMHLADAIQGSGRIYRVVGEL